MGVQQQLPSVARGGRRPLPEFMALYRLPTSSQKGAYQLGQLKGSAEIIAYDIALLPGRKPREQGFEFLGLGKRLHVIQWDS